MLAAALLVGCEKQPGSQGAAQQEQQQSTAGGGAGAPSKPHGPVYTFTMAIYDSPGNPFWNKVQAGAREAAEKLGCNVVIQFAEGNQTKMNDIMETAISKKSDGIGVTLNFDEAYDETVAKARGLGIPVIAFNIDDSKGREGNARMAYVGQKMEDAGCLIAKRLIKEGGLKKDDFVLCPVESPGAVYAEQRYRGAKKAFDEAGIRSQVLDSGNVSLNETLTRMTQFLLGNRNTNAILAMGQMPMEMAPKAAEDSGLKIPTAGFDISNVIIQNILDGKTIATVDQQPFYQGLNTLVQLYYYKKYGLLPCDINTGGAMVDKTNAEQVRKFSDTVR
jgi:simple sugar transport system substrate-binding protein